MLLKITIAVKSLYLLQKKILRTMVNTSYNDI